MFHYHDFAPMSQNAPMERFVRFTNMSPQLEWLNMTADVSQKRDAISDKLTLALAMT